MENIKNDDGFDDKAKSIVKDFFLNLATFVSLYILSISFIVLLFQIINSIFPDNIFSDTNAISTFSLSSVIVLTPVFFYLAYKTNKEISKTPEKKEMWIRRWLTYITMFFAGATIITDGIVLINYFLNGDLTTRFFAKVLVILLIPGFIFWYLTYGLKRDYTKNPYNKTLAVVVILIILATIIGAFIAVGSPSKNRMIRVDQERVRDLSMIQNEIISFWQTKNRLPENIDEVSNPLQGFVIPNDPETDTPYIYKVTGPENFALCATFETEQLETNSRAYEYGLVNETWIHEKGEVCFDRTIDPERFTKPIY